MEKKQKKEKPTLIEIIIEMKNNLWNKQIVWSFSYDFLGQLLENSMRAFSTKSKITLEFSCVIKQLNSLDLYMWMYIYVNK